MQRGSTLDCAGVPVREHHQHQYRPPSRVRADASELWAVVAVGGVRQGASRRSDL